MVMSALRHGHTVGRKRTPEHRAWCQMRGRCERTTSPDYKDYGARGIRVAERWKTFDNFLADMGLRPPGHSLDRIDNNRGYEPENCRWATPRQQRLNQRHRPNAVLIDLGGTVATLKQWMSFFKLPSDNRSYQRRLKYLRRGRPLERVFRP